MSILEIRHDFTDTEARNNEKLYQAFCNYVYLGQWELCRICLELLYTKRRQLNTNLEELLIDIIRNPTSYCTQSKSVPSPFHFALLLIEECRTKQYLDSTLIESLKLDVIYKFLLLVGDIQPSAQIIREFEQLRRNTDALPSTLLTDSMADFLVDLWLNETERVYTLVSLYIYSSIPSINLWLLDIHKRALEASLQNLTSLNTEQHKVNLVDLLLSLHFYSFDNTEFCLLIRDILTKIVIYATKAKYNSSQLFNLETFYRSVLNNRHLSHLVSDIESEYRRKSINNDTIIMHFHQRNSSENRRFFWNELYLYLIENKVDLITCVLNDSISMVRNRDYSSLETLLGLKELKSLHLYIFLVAWTNVKTINDASVLFNLMSSLLKKTPISHKCLNLYESQVEFLKWLEEAQRYPNVTSPLPDIDDLLSSLHQKSPLLVIHQYVDVKSIDPEAIIDILEKTSMGIEGDSENIQSQKRVRFADTSNTNDSIRLPSRVSSMIFRGYLSINHVIQHILSNNENQSSDEIFVSVRSNLRQIYPLRFRLELLENIFSLIFIEQSVLKLDETIEISDKSSGTPSISLSTSDKIHPLLQSQLTNDSFLDSTNASTKTQITTMQFENDVDEKYDDDNGSVCSSSMSSANTAQLHSMYRSGLLINEEILYRLLSFVQQEIAELRTLKEKMTEKIVDRDTISLEASLDKCFDQCSIKTEAFESRLAQLNKFVRQAMWRYDLLVVPKDKSILLESKTDEQDDNESIIYNPTIKDLILPVPVHRRSHRRKRQKRFSESSISSLTSNIPTKSTVTRVSQILSNQENLLAICLKEGKIIEANEVIRQLHMQNHPLAVEAEFSKLFRETVFHLVNCHTPMSISTDNPPSSSALADLATFASSALDNSSAQNHINTLLTSIESSNVAKTLPTSSYFDEDHFPSLTLFDLALNAPTASISKTLFDMAKHRLPITCSGFSSNNNNNTNNNKSSTVRIKSLSDMIVNYTQLTNVSQGSLKDLILDVTVPLDGKRASNIVQYYKRIEEHCRQYYLNNQNAMSIQEQVMLTRDFFENDSQAKFDIISYIRNESNQKKLSTDVYINYFSLFHTYLQNFRVLLDKFPIQEFSNGFDFTKYSPLSLIHRIVAQSTDIDLSKLQLMTSKLNIDISLAVSLNIIRPLFSDKIIETSSLSSHKRTTFLQQQAIDIFSYRRQSQQHPIHLLPNENATKVSQRTSTFIKRLVSKIDEFQNDSHTFNEHPEKFARKLLTKLTDTIKKTIKDSPHNYMTIECVEKLYLSDDYEELFNVLPLLTYIDLDRLETNAERICFFANLYTFLLIISHIEFIRTTSIQISTRNLFRNDLERLLFLLTTRIDIGKLKQLSLFEIRYYILKQNIPINGLRLDIDPNGPFYQYSPELPNDQNIKIGLLLTDCIYSSTPLMILTPELLNEQIQRSTSDFIDKCVAAKINGTNDSINIILPNLLYVQFDKDDDNMAKFIRKYSSNNDVVCALSENRKITTEIIQTQTDFAICFDYSLCSSHLDKQGNVRRRRRRTSSLPSTSTITTLTSSSSIDFTSPTTGITTPSLPNHLIDSRTIAFVQEKSPALGQILQIYVQSVVQNQSIQSDKTPLEIYFSSLLLSPKLIESTLPLGDEWFRSIVLNDSTYQHDLLLYLCSILWNKSKYLDIVNLFDSLLPAFILNSPYCQMLRDISLLILIKETSKPDDAYKYLHKIHDCHLLIHATLTYLPRFDGPTSIKLLELCLTSCKKTHPEYIPWIQERLNTMYIYKTLCLSALSQFDKIMKKQSENDITTRNLSLDDLAIQTTSKKCLTWQLAAKHSLDDPIAVADMFILEHKFDMGHKWLALLYNKVNRETINSIKLRLVEEHIHCLLKDDNGNGNKILGIIDTIEDQKTKWNLCVDVFNDLSNIKPTTTTKAIPFSKLYIKFRLVEYMLENFEQNPNFFIKEFDRTKVSVLTAGLTIFFDCIPLEQADSYVHLVEKPILILEQLLMNSSMDIAKMVIEKLKLLIKKYSLAEILKIKQIDDLIEFYTRKSVKLNVVHANDDSSNNKNRNNISTTSDEQIGNRRGSLAPSMQTNQTKLPVDASPLGRRQNSGGASSFIDTFRQRLSPKLPSSTINTHDSDQHSPSLLTTTLASNANSPPYPNSIPIKSLPQEPLSVLEYLSSFSSLNPANQNLTTGTEQSSSNDFSVPITAPSKALWIRDNEVSVCMCCNETRFSMFNRRHHCRRCGRVVCKPCSQQMTIIKDRLERTCTDCYKYMQSNRTSQDNPRPETPSQTKTIDRILRSKSTATFKRQSIIQYYTNNEIKNNSSLGTSFTGENSAIIEEDAPVSSSYTTTSLLLRTRKGLNQSLMDSPSKQDNDNELPILPVITDHVHHQLAGTSNDETIRNDFHYDQSPSISLCLSLIELHSDQYECGKLLIKLCEYLSEQLSTQRRNIEIDYALVLNIIKNLLFTAKMKLMTSMVNDEQLIEQQKLIASCDRYNNLVDILSRLNMANYLLPALNELSKQDTLLKIRNQLLENERYQLALEISTKCNLDTQIVWFQWGMAYLYIGQYDDARDKFDKCLHKTIEKTDAILKQLQRANTNQEKMLNDIISYLETSRGLRCTMKNQYLVQQRAGQQGQKSVNLKYLNNLPTILSLNDESNKSIKNEILFYIKTYSDDAHLLDYYIRHKLYMEAFEHKSSLTLFRDHIYIPLLKSNQLEILYKYISKQQAPTFTHHLKFIVRYFQDENMYHSLQQLQLFMNDYINAGYTSISLFNSNRKTYIDLYENRLNNLENALKYFQCAKIDSKQTADKVQCEKVRTNLQIELTRYIYSQLQRLQTNGTNIFINCPTLFDGKDSIMRLILCLIKISDGIANSFNLINKIICDMKIPANEAFLSCAGDIGKRRDYDTITKLLPIMNDNGYTDIQLHDGIIEECIKQAGSDVDKSVEQDKLIQSIKNDDTRINVYISVGKLRAAYLIAVRLGKDDKVRMICDEAQKLGQSAIYGICKKWLESRSNEQ